MKVLSLPVYWHLMNHILSEKNKIRQAIAEMKKKMPPGENRIRSRLIFAKIEKDSYFLRARTILAYWSMPDEVFSQDFILKWFPTKTIILPAVEGDILRLKEFKGVKNLVPGGKYNIPEPSGEYFPDTRKIEIAIVPGVAFDRGLNRMGRGKAYYDKLLPSLHARKYGVCFDFQLLERIPATENDIQMDRIFTDLRISIWPEI